MRTLIFGHTGQDGRILWNQLVERGDSLIGISRSGIRCHAIEARRNLVVTEPYEVRCLIEEFKPDHVYYLAACHHSSQDTLNDESAVWHQSWQTHVHAFENVLESLRTFAPRAQVFYASSSRIFGMSASSPQNEVTPWEPVCIYGTTKAAGMLVAGHYRRVHAMHVSCGILYNHESPIRGSQFVSKRVIEGFVAVKRGKRRSVEIGSLDARVDWGYAPDYTRAMYLMLDRKLPSDLVIATGKTHSVRDLAASAANKLNLKWEDIVFEKAKMLQRQPQKLCGDASRLRTETGWEPSVGFDEMVEIMVDAALASKC